MLSSALTALWLSAAAQTAVLIQPTLEPQATGSRTTAPPNAYLAPATGGAVRKGGALIGSRFQEWYPAARRVVDRARKACSTAAAWDGWCGRYWGTNAKLFDVQPLVDSEGLAVASYLVAQRAIQQAFGDLAASADVKGSAVATALDDIKNDVDVAAGLASQNAGIGLGLLPGIDLGAQAQKLMEGIAAAMKERAEQEAVLYVLEIFDHEVCTDGAVKPFLWNTCTLAESGAFSGTVAGGGAATIELLRNALEADVRALPGHVGRTVVTKGYADKWIALPPETQSANAEAVGNLVDDLVRGVRPERAFETFSTALAPGPDADDATTTRAQRAVRLLACAAALPAAISRAGQLVDVTWAMASPNARGLALALVAVESSRCVWLYEAVWGKEFDHVPFAGGAGRLRLWARYTDGLSAAALEMNDAEQFLVAARAAVDKALVAARESGDPEGVAVAIADGAFAALDAADAATRLASQLVALARAAPLTAQGTVQADQMEAAIAAAALAIRRVRSYGDLVHAAAAHDHGKTVQAALRASVVTDRSGAEKTAVPKALQQSLGLVVAIVNAKSPDEVKRAVLAAAAPAGSWRLKYAAGAGGHWNGAVTLGGLVGFGASWARTPGTDPRVLFPVGFDFVPYAWSHMNVSLFFQLLDVAGYAAQGDRKPRVLQGVVPGVSIKVPVGKSPFAAFAGVTYPLDDGRDVAGPAWRWNAGVAVDVSLFVVNRP